MVSSSYPRFAGDVIAPFIEEMAAGVAAMGVEVHVLLPYHPQLQVNSRRGVTLHSYRFKPFDGLGRWGFASSMVADERLRWQAIAVAPAALISLVLAFRRLWRVLDPEVAHIHWVVPNGLVGFPRWSLPQIVSLHGSDVFVAERHRLARWAARNALQRASVITGCSSDLIARALRLGAPEHAVRWLPYGVDEKVFCPGLSRFDLRLKCGSPPEGPIFLAVGRLAKKKGFHILLEATAQLRRTTKAKFMVVIAGGGDLLGHLRRMAADLGITDVVSFIGPVDRNSLPDLYRAADAYVLPSVRDESGNVDGLPNVLLEAMATGLPVIASALAGALDVIQNGVTGRLVPWGDPKALAQAMAEIVEDPNSAWAMGRAARDFVLENLTWKRVCRQLMDLYHQAKKGGAWKPTSS